MKHQLPRTRSGRPSRSKAAKEWRAKHETYYPGETEREATATGYAARTRVYGIDPAIAHLPELGYLFGRMYLGQVLSPDQFHAARYWLRVRSDMLRAIAAPGRPVEPAEGPTGILSPEEEIARVEAAQEKYEAILKWLDETPGRFGLYEDMLDALDKFLVAEQHVPRLLGPLERALDRIAEFMREPKRG